MQKMIVLISSDPNDPDDKQVTEPPIQLLN